MNFRESKGSAFIISMVSFFAILVIMAALFYIGRFHVSKTQADGTARNIVLSSLKEYYKSEKECKALFPNSKPYQKICRLNRASVNSEELATINKLLADKDEGEIHKLFLNGSNESIIAIASKNAANRLIDEKKMAYLRPGQWIYDDNITIF